ncbi:MAG: radical SAM protein [Nanoarchaeota archaeon]
MVKSKQTVLLLNPPGRKMYIRDYYCSKVSKANYYPQPVDLLTQSGWLATKYEVKLIDAIVDEINEKDCLAQIYELNPDIILFITGSVSWDEDLPFLEKVAKINSTNVLSSAKSLPRRKDLIMVGSGDIFKENGHEKIKKYPWINAVVLNFSTDGVLQFLQGNEDQITDLIYRTKKGEIKSAPESDKRGEWKLPMPRQDLFVGKNYRYPFATGYPMATMLTNYGCPYKCTFCIMSTLGYTFRKVPEIIAEMKVLKKLGVKYIYFSDQTFGVHKPINQELCKAMIKEKFGFQWVCFSRVDVMDELTLTFMKQAGCDTIMFGVEFADDKLLDIYIKDFHTDQVRKTFHLARKVGIKTMGTFLMGVPEENEEDCLRTIEFAKELKCDYASFNFAVPRMGTGLRKKALEQKLITKDVEIMDQAGTFVAMGSNYLTKKQISRLRRRAIITFYFRPWYVINRFRKLRSWPEFKTQFLEAYHLTLNLIHPK